VEAAKVSKENIVAVEKNEEGKVQNKEREGEEGRVLVLVADILGFPVSSSSSLCALIFYCSHPAGRNGGDREEPERTHKTQRQKRELGERERERGHRLHKVC